MQPPTAGPTVPPAGDSRTQQQHGVPSTSTSSSRQPRHQRHARSRHHAAPSAPLLAAVLLAGSCLQAVAAGSWHAAADSSRQLLAQVQPTGGLGPHDVRLAIVNQVHFHLEVVAGAMTLFSQASFTPPPPGPGSCRAPAWDNRQPHDARRPRLPDTLPHAVLLVSPGRHLVPAMLGTAAAGHSLS